MLLIYDLLHSFRRNWFIAGIRLHTILRQPRSLGHHKIKLNTQIIFILHTSSNDATYVVTKLFLYTYFPSQIPYRLSLGVKEVSTLRIKVKIIFVLNKNIKK